MTEEMKQWEYRVLTIGSVFGTKDEDAEAILNEWAGEGWEATHVFNQQGSGIVTIVARRVLTPSARRARSMPTYP